MKSKKTIYLLGLLVAIIWGFIIYRFIDAMSDDASPLVSAPATLVKEAYDDYALPKDTTHLQTGYRDPFGLVPFRDTTVRISKKTDGGISHPINRPPAINWIGINYLGYIRNPGSKKLIAIMHINGKEVMMAEGENTEQVRLLKNLRDSIRISYHGQTKFITLKPASL